MKKIFKKLYQLKQLTELESYHLFKNIINKNINSIEIASILTIINMRTLSISEIIGAIKIFQKTSLIFKQPKYDFSDISGTGGDNVNIINVSTISALVASCMGFKIIKHCNRGISSKIGSADILKKLKVNLDHDYDSSMHQLQKLNISFLYAPKYHPGFQYVSKVRKTLQVKTIFNILGPLLNPAHPNFAVIGVYSKKLLIPFAKILHALNYERVIIINSDGIDEVTLHHVTNVLEIKNGKIYSYTLSPEDFGVPRVEKKFFTKKTAQDNYNIVKDLFKGCGDIEYKYLIAVNVAMLLKIFGYEDLKENTKQSLEIINNGQMNTYIKKFYQ